MRKILIIITAAILAYYGGGLYGKRIKELSEVNYELK